MLKLILASPKKDIVRNAVIILREKIPDVIQEITTITYHDYPDCLYETEIYLKKYTPEIWKVCKHPEISYCLTGVGAEFNKDELIYNTIKGIKGGSNE